MKWYSILHVLRVATDVKTTVSTSPVRTRRQIASLVYTRVQIIVVPEKLRDHRKTQARGYRPAVEPADKAASDKAAAKAAAKAAVKAAAKAATKQNGDRSREAKAAAKARIRSQARREARRAHK